jgi:hypothetical protein
MIQSLIYAERKNLIWMKLQVLIYSLKGNVLPVILFH